MRLTLLAPLALLVGLLVAVPLAAHVASERRIRAVRAALRLAEPRTSGRPVALAIVAVAALVAIGAAKPAVERTRVREARADAEAFVVLDTSRSMLARRSPDAATRFERARRAAARIRRELSEVPVGLASLTDRVLPHAFPTVNGDAFERTLERAVGVDRPPPLQRGGTVATSFDGLRVIPTRNFFSPRAERRLVFVLTDGETRRFGAGRIRGAFRDPRLSSIVVRFWAEGEQVFGRGGAPEAAYKADPASAQAVAELARATRGRAFDEDELPEAIRVAQERLGKGKTRPTGEEVARTSLAPYFFLAAFVPLGFLLRRRNL